MAEDLRRFPQKPNAFERRTELGLVAPDAFRVIHDFASSITPQWLGTAAALKCSFTGTQSTIAAECRWQQDARRSLVSKPVITVSARDTELKTHLVSFRIGEVGNANARRDSLVETAHLLSKVGVWDETPSFILLKSNQSAHEIATELYMRSAMRHDLDTLLVIDLDTKRYSTQGKVEFPNTLGSFFPGMPSDSGE